MAFITMCDGVDKVTHLQDWSTTTKSGKDPKYFFASLHFMPFYFACETWILASVTPIIISVYPWFLSPFLQPTVCFHFSVSRLFHFSYFYFILFYHFILDDKHHDSNLRFKSETNTNIKHTLITFCSHFVTQYQQVK